MAKTAHKLVPCATNKRAWPRRDIRQCARRDHLLAAHDGRAVYLFDIADARGVRPLGSVAVPELDGDDELPLGFHGDVLAVGHATGHVVIDVAKPAKPHVAGRYPAQPRRDDGHITGGVYYARSRDRDGVFAQRIGSEDVVRFDSKRSRHAMPSAYAHVGELLYVITPTALEVHRLVDGLPAADSTAIKRKKIDTAATAIVHVAANGLLAVVSGSTDFGVRVVDPATPANPKVQPRVMKQEPRGSGITDDTLFVVTGDGETGLDLVLVGLARPRSVAWSTARLTDDADFADGLAFMAASGDDLLVLSTHGRFGLFR